MLALSYMSAAAAFFSRAGSAQTTPEPIGWAYHAPPECPSAAGFQSEFRSRTTRADLVDTSDTPRSFNVALTNEANGTVGRIEIRQPGGSVATREVTGRTCQGVASALALIAALAVDPNAAASPAPRLPIEATPAETPPPAFEPTSPWAIAVGIDGGAVVGLFPKPAPRVSLFGEARARRASLFAPSVRLSASGAVGSSVGELPGSATFRWLAASLDACPLRLRLVESLHAMPCVFVEGGILSGRGADVTAPAVESRRWVALGMTARLQWQIAASFFLEAQGRLEAPLARDTFVFEAPERVVVHVVPPVLGGADIGIGVRWP